MNGNKCDSGRVNVVLGAQWGDEGKGKLVDLLAERADVVARCQVSTRCTVEWYEGLFVGKACTVHTTWLSLLPLFLLLMKMSALLEVLRLRYSLLTCHSRYVARTSMSLHYVLY